MILVINSSFSELNHLAAAAAEAKVLSRYVRLYGNMGGTTGQVLTTMPGIGSAYAKFFGRRKMPFPLVGEHIQQAALVFDFAMVLHARLPYKTVMHRKIRRRLTERINKSVAEAGAKALNDEQIVVASWTCAEPAFRKAKTRGAICVLNYSLAHHAFSQRYLQEEAEREPAFAATLNSYDRPDWQLDQLDREVELADHILVGSSFVRDTFILEGVPSHKLEVVPYGVDTSIFHPGVSKSEDDASFNIVFAGQLSQRKGLSYLLRAYEQICDDKTTLTLVGQLMDDGSSLRPWRHLFRHIPHVPRSQLAMLFQQSDVFLFPTLIEGMPLVVIEAMASGLPVITTPNGPCDIVRDGVEGYLVPPRDVDGLVRRMAQLRRMASLRKNMGMAAEARAQSYTWEAYRKMLLTRLMEWLDDRQ